jgi:hypothetical protein
VPEISASMHDARDAEDIRLLEAHDHAKLLATYYPVIVERCRLRLPDPDAYEVAHRVIERLLRELAAGRRYAVPFRVVVHVVLSQGRPSAFGPGAGELRRRLTRCSTLGSAPQSIVANHLLHYLDSVTHSYPFAG